MRRITITYDGKPDNEIDARIAAVLEYDLDFELEYDLDFEWEGQGYNFKEDKRDISFCEKKRIK